MQCELCHFTIKSNMKLRPMNKIAIDVFKAIKKKFRKDKLYVLKVLLYTAYIYISAKKAVSCFKLLVQQFKKHRKGKPSSKSSIAFNLLSILYLMFVMLQLFMIYTKKVTQLYRNLKMKMRLICYEVTFESKSL